MYQFPTVEIFKTSESQFKNVKFTQIVCTTDFGSFLLIPPLVEAQNLTPPPPPTRRSELVSDWLKLTRTWVKTLRHLLFRISIMVCVVGGGGGVLNQWVGINRKDPWFLRFMIVRQVIKWLSWRSLTVFVLYGSVWSINWTVYDFHVRSTRVIMLVCSRLLSQFVVWKAKVDSHFPEKPCLVFLFLWVSKTICDGKQI